MPGAQPGSSLAASRTRWKPCATSAACLRQIGDSQQVFSNLAAWTPVDFDLATGGESRPAQGLWVSGNFFQTLGISPAYGRLIEPRDDRAGCPAAVAVISYPFWQREFGGDLAAVGKALRVDGHLFEIAGITPAAFFGIDSADTLRRFTWQPCADYRQRRVIGH